MATCRSNNNTTTARLSKLGAAPTTQMEKNFSSAKTSNELKCVNVSITTLSILLEKTRKNKCNSGQPNRQQCLKTTKALLKFRLQQRTELVHSFFCGFQCFFQHLHWTFHVNLPQCKPHFGGFCLLHPAQIVINLSLLSISSCTVHNAIPLLFSHDS